MDKKPIKTVSLDELLINISENQVHRRGKNSNMN